MCEDQVVEFEGIYEMCSLKDNLFFLSLLFRSFRHTGFLEQRKRFSDGEWKNGEHINLHVSILLISAIS